MGHLLVNAKTVWGMFTYVLVRISPHIYNILLLHSMATFKKVLKFSRKVNIYHRSNLVINKIFDWV